MKYSILFLLLIGCGFQEEQPFVMKEDTFRIEQDSLYDWPDKPDDTVIVESRLRFAGAREGYSLIILNNGDTVEQINDSTYILKYKKRL